MRGDDDELPPPGGGQQCLDLFRVKRFGEEIPLSIFAAQRPQNDEVLSGLDAFGNDLSSELMGQRNDGFHDREGVVVCP